MGASLAHHPHPDRPPASLSMKRFVSHACCGSHSLVMHSDVIRHCSQHIPIGKEVGLGILLPFCFEMLSSSCSSSCSGLLHNGHAESAWVLKQGPQT